MTWRSQQANVTEFIGPIPRVVGCVLTPTTPRRLSRTALEEKANRAIDSRLAYLVGQVPQ